MRIIRTSYSSFAVICILMFAGCQSLQPTEKGELSLHNTEFMTLWDTYNQCASGQNLLHMREYAHQLSEAPRPISMQHSPIPLPKFLLKLASTRSSRLSVDPRAMAASCALQAGQTARDIGDYSVAKDLFQTVIENYPEPEYAFYVAEARTAIDYIPSIRNVSLPY